MFARNQRKGDKPGEVALGRVVTPMLDMTFQLLFYFVMQFKPPISEGQMDFNLPSVETGPSSNTDPLLDDKPDEYRITIIAPSGVPEAMLWKTKTGAPEPIPIGDNAIRAIEDKLKTIVKPAEGSKAKPPVIKIEAHKKLKYSVLVLIMDACKRSGFTDVGVMPLPKDKPGKVEGGGGQ